MADVYASTFLHGPDAALLPGLAGLPAEDHVRLQPQSAQVAPRRLTHVRVPVRDDGHAATHLPDSLQEGHASGKRGGRFFPHPLRPALRRETQPQTGTT